MQPFRSFFAAAGVAVLAGVLSVASPAQAACPGEDGTIPGTQSSVTTVETPAATLYVDDRDFLDIDDDGDAYGLRVYLESNGKDGLQRGGDQVAFRTLAEHGVDPTIPYIPPTAICDPVLGKCVYLFPHGSGSSSTPGVLGMSEWCWESTNPDTLLF